MIPDMMPAAALAPLVLAAGGFDIAQRRIPNWLVAMTLAGGLAAAALAPDGGAILSHLAHAAIALAVGMGLYALRLIGAGDAKFYAAVAAWFSLSEGMELLFAVALAGLLFALGWISLRRLFPRKRRAPAAPDRDKLPFGVAIALGTLMLVVWQL